MMLHLIISRHDCIYYPLETVVEKAIIGGVTHVQLREKKASTREILELGKVLKKLLSHYSVPLIINDRVDIALAIDAEGVHMGQSDMPYEAARRLMGKKKIIGLTIENTQQAVEANQWPVDYIGVGPIFPTQTKLDAPAAIGVNGLIAIRNISHHPIIPIGGINLINLDDIFAVGVEGIGLVSAICSARHPEKIAQTFKEKMTHTKKETKI